jgi:hypothetical protein
LGTSAFLQIPFVVVVLIAVLHRLINNTIEEDIADRIGGLFRRKSRADSEKAAG